MSAQITRANRRQALDSVLLDALDRLQRDRIAVLAHGVLESSALIALIDAWRSRIADLRQDLRHGRIVCDAREHSPPKRSKY